MPSQGLPARRLRPRAVSRWASRAPGQAGKEAPRASAIKENGFGGGIVARYTAPVYDDVYVGFQKSLSIETAESQLSGNFDLFDSTARLDQTVDIDWSADMLNRLGANLGGVGIYVAGGLALAQISAEWSGTVDSTGFSARTSATHLGYKLVAGVDVPFDEIAVAFVQVEYADYRKAGSGRTAA